MNLNTSSGRRVLRAAGLAVALLAAGAPSASASHLQGASIAAKVTAEGRIQGTIAFLARGGCVVGSQTTIPLTISSPGAQQISISAPARATRCIAGSATYTGTYDVPLDATSFSGGAPDGVYTVRWIDSARVSGIVNLTSTFDVRVTARVRKITGQATSAPVLASEPATGIGIGDPYSQDLTASDPDDPAATLTYEALQGAPDSAPDTNVIDVPKLQASGIVEIPAATTATYAPGSFRVYKVRVTDAQGDSVERDVLLTASTNRAPVIADLSTSEDYVVASGTTRTITFSATDPNADDVVTLSAAGLPSWATLTQTPGNPAQATLTLAPPADATAGTSRVSIAAVDDDATLALVASTAIGIRVVSDAEAPTATLAGGPSGTVKASSATFAFTSDDPTATFTCQLDGGAWLPCTSPREVTGLADGSHTFAVRATDPAGNVQAAPAARTWTVDGTAPAPPVVLAGPERTGTSTTASFTFSTEDGGTVECRLDGGAWQLCPSPLVLSGLAAGTHALELRATDAAGNVSEIRTETWNIVVATPVAETAPAGPIKAAVLAPATITPSSDDSAEVGCALRGERFKWCRVAVYAKKSELGLVKRGSKRDGLVLIGHGWVKPDAPATRAPVDIELTPRGRAAARRLGGVKVRVEVRAKPTSGGDSVPAIEHTTIRPARQLVVPSDGLFGTGSAMISRKGKRYLQSLAGALRDAKTIRCTGHTHAGPNPAANVELGKRRAKAVCGYLGRLGVKADTSIRSAGQTDPRASNDTAAGQRLNRRVELTVSYR